MNIIHALTMMLIIGGFVGVLDLLAYWVEKKRVLPEPDYSCKRGIQVVNEHYMSIWKEQEN